MSALVLSPRELEIVSFAMLSNKSQVDIDWVKFKDLAGLTESSAKTIWYKLHKKIRESGGIAPAKAKGGQKRGRKPANSDLKTTNTAADNKRAIQDEEAINPAKPKRARKNNIADTPEPKAALDQVKDESVFTADDVATSIDTDIHEVGAAEYQSEHGAAATGGDTVSLQSLYRNPPDYEYLGFGGYDASSPAAHDSMGGSVG
ncbi:hypothetical protein BDZ85DRAFT_306925 [Elsinoe ampelina]|uniref:Uncharacterized protein n=1 Tax=Elsinoe ampelina TaxID=302913 RepID=A0A6A6G0B4_9PEZI|nr:hypothetical protein BDZ85DRAFT_306925 [Elsinoe ampelina]